MYRSNTNIIGFLQKKAFFNRSPSPSPSPNSRFATQPRNPSPNKPTTMNRTETRGVPLNRNIFEVSEAETKKAPHAKQNIKEGLKQRDSARNFQSSRVEIRMCIQDLSTRIASELKHLEASISELTVSLQTQFHKRLSQLKQDLLTQIQQTFTQARNNLNHVLSSNNEKYLKQLLLSKRELGDHQRKLKQYKVGLQSNWRKIAGELFSSDSDQKIQKALSQSEKFRRALAIKPNESPPQQETHFWKTIKTNIQSLVQKRCR